MFRGKSWAGEEGFLMVWRFDFLGFESLEI